VAPGELIGLVGPSGGGKSTVVNLIARFYDPTGGSLRIDGVDLRQIDTGHYREQIGMVLQDPYLFHGTVLDNIRYAMPQATSGAVIAAAKAANAHDFVCKLAQGYDTIVGERGHTLSGGRAAANLDCAGRAARPAHPDSRRSDEQRRYGNGAADPGSTRSADRRPHRVRDRAPAVDASARIAAVRDREGRLAESGTHKELLAVDGGIYKRLYELQLQLA
jgi:ATP-binding cassette subfamily B protein